MIKLIWIIIVIPIKITLNLTLCVTIPLFNITIDDIIQLIYNEDLVNVVFIILQLMNKSLQFNSAITIFVS